MLGEMVTYAWRELRRRKWRTGATVLGYCLAVAVAGALTGAMWSRRAAEDTILRSTGRHFVAFAPADAAGGAPCPVAYIDPEREGLIAVGNNQVPTQLLAPALLGQVKQIPTVREAAGCLLFRFKAPDGHLFTVAGIDPADNLAVGTTCCAPADVLPGGRYLDPGGQPEVMVEEAYAKAHRMQLGQKLSVAGTSFPVVGIVNSGIRPAKADVYMPLGEAERLVNSRIRGEPVQGRFNVLLVEALSSDVQQDAMRQVKRLNPELVISTYACYRPAAQVLGMNASAIRLLIVLVACGVVLFAAHSQFASVLERRRDIGVLKAVGWSGREVLALVLAESVIQGLLGGLLGAAAALLGLIFSGAAFPAGAAEATAPMGIIAAALGAGVLLALGGGVLAGIAPALLAARVNPAEAIRRL